MAIDPDTAVQLAKIFMPYAMQKTDELQCGGKLVHYTTADVAIKIIRSQTIWLRNARAMHDFSEVQHGFTELKSCLGADDSLLFKRLCAALDGCAAGAGQETIRVFDHWWKETQFATYIACFSRHDDAEDQYGRLSMWRAFSQDTAGVAFVLRPPPPNAAAPARAILSPVGYFNQQDLKGQVEAVIAQIEANLDFLRRFEKPIIVGYAHRMLLMAVVSMKHQAFKEEQEWRVIHLPNLDQSPHLFSETEVVSGIPQIVWKLPLKNNPEIGITNLTIPELLDRIIIGPTSYPASIWEALVRELNLIGVQDAHQKVYSSGIPLR
ncbi:DUF2971 domain-containing protein [Candidimonas humi]|uniref:DUF2971 domain-containing protein n=1 Tax=Candidimonas humi TaxID=683355 RepID=A0ABV8P3U6_9BURK|nr:DUF2971 domain-containing protein [Candidimonas humi]MBV6306172.1 DUF2971 domain-containing protein [Candidimonas humi]